MSATNIEVHTAANSDLTLEGMGTTLVAALDAGDEVIIASVGDSRAYLLAGESFDAVTQDQSWVNVADAAGEYRIIVRALKTEAYGGSYEIKVEAIRKARHFLPKSAFPP